MLFVAFYTTSPMAFVYSARVKSEKDAIRMAECDDLRYIIIAEI